MESYSNSWILEEDDTIVIPANWQEMNKEKRYKADSIAELAIFWEQWQRAEEKHRYFNGNINTCEEPEILSAIKNLMPIVTRVLELDIDLGWETVEFIANERMNRRIMQTSK